MRKNSVRPIQPLFQPLANQWKQHSLNMTPLILAYTPVLAAAGWAFLTYLLGGGAGLAILVFIVFKMMGK